MPDQRPTADLNRKAYKDRSLTFKLLPTTLSFDDFDRFVRYVRRLIYAVSLTYAGDGGNWVLTDLAIGSATLAAAPRTLNGISGDVEDAIVDGLATIQRDGVKPAYFSEEAIRYAGVLASLARMDGIEVTAPSGRQTFFTSNMRRSVHGILASKRVYWGSIVGNLDTVSVHRGTQVMVYGEGGQVVRCQIMNGDSDSAKDYLGQRVLVVGLVSANGMGNVLSIKVDQIYPLPPTKFAGVSAFFGAIPDITSGLDGAAYLESHWTV